jgi:endonuclease/exonuclease/phosphatase family metal-dependent hydrolase
MKNWVNGAGGILLTAMVANSAPAYTPASTDDRPVVRDERSLSVMTYNVHGLPWPVAADRSDDLRLIGQRLAQLRLSRQAPDVVVIQEAFTAEAKSIGLASGYRHVLHGNGAEAASGGGPSDANWLKGEGLGAALDSGLLILSDRPVVAVRREAFRAANCAGFDCLAAKGALIATVQMPGGQMVDVVTAHLNSRTASGVDHDRSRAAWLRQLNQLTGIVRTRQMTGRPVILAGDFNVGKDLGRRQAFARAWQLGIGGGGHVALASLARQDRRLHGDLRYVMQRGRDWVMSFDGHNAQVSAVGASVVFGRNPGGRPLSDHVGYSVTYRMQAR